MSEELGEIRKLLIQHARKIPSYTLRIPIISNLLWLRYKKQVEFVARIAPKGARVLDIGCGLGQTTAMLAILRPDLKVRGIDLNNAPTWIDIEKYCSCQFQVGDALNLPVGEGKFGVVISFGTMEHVKNDKKFLSEIYRVLSTGGHNFIFNLPNRYALPEFLGKMFVGASHERRYVKQEIIKLLANAGFRDFHIEKEFIVPAHVDRVSETLGKIFDKHYLLIDIVDSRLSKVLAFFESFRIHCRK
jgi:ubiquinone/menaquinone biosynthesis C-methylase UbiE